MKKDMAENTAEWDSLDKRDSLLKKLLVCLYGYSGSDLNRFGNVFAYREVNRIGRDTIVSAMNIALKDRFDVIYLDTDSIFLKKGGAAIEEFQALASKIGRETGYQISVANHYRYLVLLPQEADPEIEAARRFYGKLANGKVYYRGIELRRHDYPVFLKHFQQQLLETILEAETAANIKTGQLNAAMQLVQETIEDVRTGEVPLSELTITKMLRMPIEDYRSLFPHVIAAVQLKQNRKTIKPGEPVDYVYVDTQQVNPMRRIAAADYADSYDIDKYTEMLLDVAESILGVFGFSRTQFGFRRRTRSFMEELRGERAKEIILELESLEPNV
jgi:DNA polymerase I